MAPISVIMSTYSGVKEEWLKLSLQSLVGQTLLPAQIVLVIDGEVSAGQISIIEKVSREHENIEFTVLRQIPQKGLAAALNYGLEKAKYSIVARMDSDDICELNRFELQYAYLDEHPDVDVVCSWHAEFETEGKILSLKQTPEKHEKIKSSLNYRNVISHPTMMLRKDSILRVGGYDESVGLLEDYDLHLRLLNAGARYYCMSVPLVNVRVSISQKNRRGGVMYLIREIKFRTKSMALRRLSFSGWVVGIFLYPIFRLSPPWLKGALYSFVRSGK
ncbi:glycosyltransferase [Chromobacterium sp. IIBBL 290-4]|uniref:glycosyltransferase n=1 Tax=Chromobacterium sp. IIBBL 290-4 TaxID=2953890 RepID=UPI0020B6FDC1|nr:glycosyltransferase [Chromobacterium sp. IIBBL 290-4]UTH72843.1 glycosyltransferase [Chromobacterium sp. IIBBL 290-4]